MASMGIAKGSPCREGGGRSQGSSPPSHGKASRGAVQFTKRAEEPPLFTATAPSHQTISGVPGWGSPQPSPGLSWRGTLAKVREGASGGQGAAATQHERLPEALGSMPCLSHQGPVLL